MVRIFAGLVWTHTGILGGLSPEVPELFVVCPVNESYWRSTNTLRSGEKDATSNFGVPPEPSQHGKHIKMRHLPAPHSSVASVGQRQGIDITRRKQGVGLRCVSASTRTHFAH